MSTPHDTDNPQKSTDSPEVACVRTNSVQPIIAEELEEPENKKCQLIYCKKDYPKHVFFIIGNEFCERFCFYGMKAVLQTYLLFQYRLSVDAAGSLFHAFTMIAYFMPLFGALLADAVFGRYWTIVSLSTVYVVGNLVMSGTAIGKGVYAGALIGMFTIAIGTGGIKPCVSAFGADQFPASMSKAREAFFSLFYVSINAGALLSQIVTPELKSVPCFGQDHCWVLAFGLPAILMVVALVLFLVGTPFYRRVPISKDSALKLFKTFGIGIARFFKRDKQRVDHWLDRAVGPDISQSFVNDCKAVLRVLVLFLPLPFFWALFDQQGSRWTLQAQKMDCYIDFANWSVQAEQIQIFNGSLILLLVPLFEIVVYPVAKKINFLVRPLQRMVTGCALAGIAFFAIGFIQIAVQRENDPLVMKDLSTYRVRVFNLHANCPLELTREDGAPLLNLKPQDTGLFKLNDLTSGKIVNISFPGNCNNLCPKQSVVFRKENTTPVTSLTISNNCKAAVEGNANSFPDAVEYLFQIQAALYSFDNSVTKMSLVKKSGSEESIRSHNPTSETGIVKMNYSSVHDAGRYVVKTYLSNGTTIQSNVLLRQGGAYTIAYGLNGSVDGVKLLVDKSPNAVSVFWQFFPYLIITCAEVMFSITGLSFAFSQAPESMKSILQAMWLMTVSLGNGIDVLIMNLRIPNLALEFIVSAIIMSVITVVFAIMTHFYQYVDSVYGKKESDDEPHNKDANKGNKDDYGTLSSEQNNQQSLPAKTTGVATDNC